MIVSDSELFLCLLFRAFVDLDIACSLCLDGIARSGVSLVYGVPRNATPELVVLFSMQSVTAYRACGCEVHVFVCEHAMHEAMCFCVSRFLDTYEPNANV